MDVFIYHDNPSGSESFRKSRGSWAVDESNLIFSVADSPLRGLTCYLRKYPQQDLGVEAADCYCRHCTELAVNFIESGSFGEAQMKEVLDFANKQIGLLNSELGRDSKDPMNYDLAETSGVTAVISGSTLYYGLLEDCYINVLRGRKYEDVLNLDYQMSKSKTYMDEIVKQGSYKKQLSDDFRKNVPEDFWYEPLWCCDLRNNSEISDTNGDFVGWGCFNGEPTAEDFFQIGSVDLEIGDKVILFNKGMIPFVEQDDFFSWFVENVNSTYEFQKEMRNVLMDISKSPQEKNEEKTLVYFNWED